MRDHKQDHPLTQVEKSEVRDQRSLGLTSIILVTHNQLEYTRLCVDSIRQHTDESFELIFIDNGSTDESVNYFRSLGESFSDGKSVVTAPSAVSELPPAFNLGGFLSFFLIGVMLAYASVYLAKWGNRL